MSILETGSFDAPTASDWQLIDLAAIRRARAPAPLRGLELGCLAELLPRLGPVLWLDCAARQQDDQAGLTRRAARSGLLVSGQLDALVAASRVTAHATVTSMGLREFLGFADAAGNTLARLYLLPDTDCLAWDEMTCACALEPEETSAKARWQAHGAFRRGAFARLGPARRARMARFELHGPPGMRTLDARPPLRLSLVGMERARQIAREEGAELIGAGD